MGDISLLNPNYLHNTKFYQVFARDAIIDELTSPVRSFHSRYWSKTAEDVQALRGFRWKNIAKICT